MRKNFRKLLKIEKLSRAAQDGSSNINNETERESSPFFQDENVFPLCLSRENSKCLMMMILQFVRATF